MLCCPHCSTLTCQQYFSALLHPITGLIQAQQLVHCSILLTTLNNVGSTTLFIPVFNNFQQLVIFCYVDLSKSATK